MKYLAKKLLTFSLITILGLQLTLTSYAIPNVSDTFRVGLTFDNQELTILDLKEALENDPDVHSLSFENGVLSFVQSNGAFTTISESVVGNVHTYTITENNQTNLVKINTDTNKIFLNNAPIQVSNNAKMVDADIISPAIADIYYGSSNPSIVAEQAIASIPAAALFTIIFNAMGGIGVVMSIIYNVISAYQIADTASRTVYASRTIYRDAAYMELRYEDTYYRISHGQGYITSKSTTVYN